MSPRPITPFNKSLYRARAKYLDRICSIRYFPRRYTQTLAELTMNRSKPIQLPECFGQYARFTCDDEFTAEDCIRCRYEAHCHKATTTDALTCIAANVSLLIDNLLDQGKIKDHRDLCPSCREGLRDGVEEEG